MPSRITHRRATNLSRPTISLDHDAIQRANAESQRNLISEISNATGIKTHTFYKHQEGRQSPLEILIKIMQIARSKGRPFEEACSVLLCAAAHVGAIVVEVPTPHASPQEVVGVVSRHLEAAGTAGNAYLRAIDPESPAGESITRGERHDVISAIDDAMRSLGAMRLMVDKEEER